MQICCLLFLARYVIKLPRVELATLTTAQKENIMHTENKTPEKLLDIAAELLEEVEELIDEIIDLEEYAKDGKKPPHARAYRFKVNETICVSEKSKIKGREILEKAGLTPPNNYTLRQKMSGGVPKRIELDEVVDLREPGIEKFRAIRKEQTEGEDQGRRNAPVLDQDRLFLDRYGLPWNVITEGCVWVVIRDFPLPPGGLAVLNADDEFTPRVVVVRSSELPVSLRS